MRELEFVHDLRAATPAPTPDRLAAGRERLMASIVAGPTGARRRRLKLRVIRTALIAGAAAAAAVVLAGGIRGTTAHPCAQGSFQVSLAGQVLHAAALNAISQRAATPRPTQWIYTKAVSYSLGGGRTSSDSWVRFDGREDAYYQDGQLIVHPTTGGDPSAASPLSLFLANPTPSTSRRALACLPENPARLLATVANNVSPSSIAGSGWDSINRQPSRAQLEFGFLADLLWNSAESAPPRAEAAAFHAMAAIPGVEARRGITDALGRPAIALSIAGVGQQLLLAPKTYQVAGERTVSNGNWPAAPKTRAHTIAKNEVVQSIAWARIEFVRAPGAR